MIYEFLFLKETLVLHHARHRLGQDRTPRRSPVFKVQRSCQPSPPLSRLPLCEAYKRMAHTSTSPHHNPRIPFLSSHSPSPSLRSSPSIVDLGSCQQWRTGSHEGVDLGRCTTITIALFAFPPPRLSPDPALAHHTRPCF